MTLESRIDALTQRVQALEDELAIHRLIVGYGLAVDIGDAERSAAVFSPDGIYDVDVGLMEGRDAVKAMIRGERHQSMVGHCAHQIGPAIVEVSGERATATGYSRVYLNTRAGTHIYRVSFNRWELSKQNGAWLITRRVTRLLGTDDAKQVFRDALDHA
ncbi:MAG: nuclear transport factor 2 family protein [Deltaproteobacteria bacterium]|nr:nuclear transport factor 2 family protein [Deltaproteobacteria bacterium]MBI3387211.1 nuclear transport factor 2 family protein [Deltaproteobacteria bacterium]